MKNIIIRCSPLEFFTPDDEALFFEWLQKINCIDEIKGIGEELLLSINSSTISFEDLLNLIGIFERYKFDNAQLRIFKTNENRHLFE